MSRVLKHGTDQITMSYAKHCDNASKGAGWAKGIDIVKQTASLEWIVSHSDGTVLKVIDYLDGTNGVPDKEGMGYGNYVIIKHTNNYCTLYAHMEKVQVKEGQKIKKGDTVGYMGNTGSARGAHLHLELRKYKTTPTKTTCNDTTKFDWLDPTPYLSADLPTKATKTIDDNIQCIHTVVKGECLWGLAARYLGLGTRYPEIVTLNNKKSVIIEVGEKLKIPKR